IIVRYYTIGLLSVARGTSKDAHDLWEMAAFGFLFLIALLGPSLTATAISQEREQQTWEALTISRLAPEQVLIGKWLARQRLVVLIFVLLCPLLFVSGINSVFGLSGTIYLCLFLLLNCGFFAAVGLLSSFSVRRTPAATTLALMISVLICLGTC